MSSFKQLYNLRMSADCSASRHLKSPCLQHVEIYIYMCSEYLMNYEITKNRHSENSPRREPGHEGSGAVNEACVTFLLNKFCFDFCCMVLHRVASWSYSRG